MDSKRIAGVGNIYACETLFAAKISPKKPARRINSSQWTLLLSTLRDILQKSIAAGGTTLRDFYSTDGTKVTTNSASQFMEKKMNPASCAPNQ